MTLSPEQRSRVREVERFAEMSVLKPLAYVVHATNSPLGLDPVPEVAAFFDEGLQRSLARFDERFRPARRRRRRSSSRIGG